MLALHAQATRVRIDQKKEGLIMIRSIKDSLICVTAFFLAVVFSLFISLPLHAQEVGDIKVHFDSEVAVPGHLLAPGDYTFHRINDNDPDTYEITANDELKFVGFVRAMPTQRARPGNTEVDLSAVDGAGVRLVQAWYPTGGTDGYQLSYSNKDLRKLAELTRAQSQSGSVGQP